MTVSIPYFAGRPLQLVGRRHQGPPHRSGGFNPLLRGATSATSRLQPHPAGWEFQSPTSRGDLCNSFSSSRSHHALRVSIPYFAGRPLQLTAHAPMRQVKEEVSIPYFAGRPLQHLGGTIRRARAHWFQSPTSRGDLCNFVLVLVPRGEEEFQSPTSRGDLCNPSFPGIPPRP